MSEKQPNPRIRGDQCRMPGCDKQGFLSLRGRPRVKFCEEHYKAVVKQIALITRPGRAHGMCWPGPDNGGKRSTTLKAY